MVKNLTYLFVAYPSRVASSSGTTTRKSLIILPGAENIKCNVSIDSCELCVERVSFASCPKTVLLCMHHLYKHVLKCISNMRSIKEILPF